MADVTGTRFDGAGDRGPGLSVGRWRDQLAAIARVIAVVAILILCWQAIIWLAAPASFVLPSPLAVFGSLRLNAGYLAGHAAITLLEMVLGLLAGAALGVTTASLMILARPVRRVLLPVIIASQALPVFAIAPLLVIWFGYGIASKVVMATLIIYFPVASAFYDGLRRTEPGLIDLARLNGAGAWRTFRFLQAPAALPQFMTGLRVAAAVAPIGAVVGEWVGAAGGLGFVMLQANARMQTDLVFASLLILAVVAIALRSAVDLLARRLVPWAERPAF